jgi:hypothetical protein
MLTRRSRRVAAVTAISLLVLSASLLVTASSTKRAAATCNGSVAKTLNHFTSGGTLVAQETVAFPGTTCNGDYQYTGALLDPITDGSCAYVYYAEPPVYLAQRAVSCTTGGWVVYTYTDTIGSNSVLVSARPSYLADEWKTSSGY